MALSKKQRAFVEHYVTCWNATQAALQAGYSERSAGSIGSENLQKLDILTAINERLEEMKMGVDEVLTALSSIARGDIADFIDIQAGEPVVNFEKAKQLNKLGLVKKIKPTKYGVEFELHDRMRALELLARHHGLLKERIEIDVNIVVELVETMKDIGLEPSEVFQNMIAKLHAERQRSD